MTEHPEIRWIQYGIAAGLAASVLYPTVLVAPLPLVATAVAAAALGPAIGIGSIGLSRLLSLTGRRVAGTLGAIHNVLAGCLFTAMAMVQLAVRGGAGDAPAAGLGGVWLGLDVAWDVYIGLGTLFFAAAMATHPRFRWPFAATGLLLGGAALALNLQTFPVPPAAAGSFDVGPLIGLWYLAATVQAWRSLRWARAAVSTATT